MSYAWHKLLYSSLFAHQRKYILDKGPARGSRTLRTPWLRTWEIHANKRDIVSLIEELSLLCSPICMGIHRIWLFLMNFQHLVHFQFSVTAVVTEIHKILHDYTTWTGPLIEIYLEKYLHQSIYYRFIYALCELKISLFSFVMVTNLWKIWVMSPIFRFQFKYQMNIPQNWPFWGKIYFEFLDFGIIFHEKKNNNNNNNNKNK